MLPSVPLRALLVTTQAHACALPLEDAVLLVMSRFNRILEIDYPNRTVTAQPGVTNLGITTSVELDGFYYAPDPSSQIACSIGGNVADCNACSTPVPIVGSIVRSAPIR